MAEQSSVALHRQPVQADREDVDQYVADDEHGDRETHDRKRREAAVEPAANAPRRQRAERHGDHDREDKRAERERERRLDALRDQLRDGLVLVERIAKVAVQHVRQPDAELRRQWPVQTKLLAHALDVLAGRVVADDHRGRIARSQAQNQEHDDRDDQQHRQDR